MCTIRVIQPMLLSFIMFTIDLKAVLVSAVYIIETIKPVAICRVRVIPSRNPMFHMNEIDLGVGRSIREFFIIFNSGLFFISCVFIKMMRIRSGRGDVHVSRLQVWLKSG